MSNEVATFEVTGHYELPERGAFLIGSIRSGSVRIGALVCSALTGARFTISGIESLSNSATNEHQNAFAFRDRPSPEEALERAFPVGSSVDAA